MTKIINTLTVTEPDDLIRTIESEAEAVRQAIISEYIGKVSQVTTQNHDRIVITVTVIIDD